MFRAADQPEDVLLWAVFASLAICGATAMLQARRIGRLGAGYILAIGTSGAAIAVSIAALSAGGPALLATLVVILALVQFVFSARLSLFRRILTPTVTGLVLMLTPVTVMPIMFDQLKNVPGGTPPLAAPLSAATTLAVIAGIALTAKGRVRLWAPVIGIVAGSIVAGVFGLYDVDRIVRASWIGIPTPEWSALDLSFGPDFWALLPAFVFIALVCTIQTISGAVAIQRVSWAGRRAVDFRAVQGAVAADGAGNLLSGLAGTMPLGFRPTGASMVEITGISSRPRWAAPSSTSMRCCGESSRILCTMRSDSAPQCRGAGPIRWSTSSSTPVSRCMRASSGDSWTPKASSTRARDRGLRCENGGRRRRLPRMRRPGDAARRMR